MKKILFLALTMILLIINCPIVKNGKSDSTNQNSVIKTDYILNTAHPASVVKICFIHHSTGSAWIATGDGNLGQALNNNNYYVTECDYGWNAQPGNIQGDHTDTGDWPSWFNDIVMPYVYNNTSHYDYDSETQDGNTVTNPGGENQIIMFKSCFPNSEVGNSIADEQSIYNSLLTYFQAHQDKMFVLVIPPPEIEIDSASLTRQLSNWLVDRKNGWLAAYPYKNVYAFNYYNILTAPSNHHHINGSGYEENIIADGSNELYYYTGGDSHPTAPGHQKATAEFLPLLNGWYNLWKNIH